MNSRGNPKKLKKAQADRLLKIARDGRRRPADRVWAANQLSTHGIEIRPNVIPGYATPAEGRVALLAAEGGCVIVDKACRLYRKPNPVTRQTLTAKIRRGEVIGYPARAGRHGFPVWQFRPEGGILEGLPAVLKALGKTRDYIEPFCFFLQPDPTLEFRTPLAALRNGEIKQVLAAAKDYARGP
jgi:hypothetical protein